MISPDFSSRLCGVDHAAGIICCIRHGKPNAGNAGADKPQRRKIERSLREAARNFRRGKRNCALNDREAKQIGIERCRLGAVNRFTECIAVDDTDHCEQDERAAAGICRWRKH